jgi:hypothetical protein
LYIADYRGEIMRILVLSISLFLVCTFPAAAEEIVCTDREQMVERLVSDFGEQLAAVKEIKGEGLLEIHVSARNGTWTALLTKTWALTCVVGNGEDAPIPDFLEIAPGVAS